MNSGRVELTVAAPNPRPEFPTVFVVATFVLAAAAGALILYFGITGQLGASIP